MPNPWDKDNIKPNLKTLSELEHGDKFRILPDSGRIDRNRYFQALTRKDTDSISKQLDSISRLFKAAIELSERGGQWANRKKGAEQPELFIARAEIQAALKGLENIKGSYADSWLPGAKGPPVHIPAPPERASLEHIISTVRGMLPESPKPTFDVESYLEAREKFTEEYKWVRKVDFRQSDYTMYGQRGICNALTLDWIRRRLLKDKGSYADSKHSRPGPLQDRIRKKADKHLQGVQNYLIDPSGRQERTVEDIADEYESFADLRQKAAGGDYWHSKKTNRFRPVLRKAREWIAREGHEHDCLELGLFTGTGAGGHSVAFAFRTSFFGTPELYFFEPNWGEFEFGIEGKAKSRLYQFFDDLWKVYALQNTTFTNWTLTAFYKEPKSAKNPRSAKNPESAKQTYDEI